MLTPKFIVKQLSLACLLFAGLESIAMANDACNSRIINNSSKPWYVSYEINDGTLTFNGSPQKCPEGNPCIIVPGELVTLSYATVGDGVKIEGEFNIIDSINESQKIAYTNLNHNEYNFCPRLHNAPSDSVVTDSPSDGGFTIQADTWFPCKPGYCSFN